MAYHTEGSSQSLLLKIGKMFSYKTIWKYNFGGGTYVIKLNIQIKECQNIAAILQVSGVIVRVYEVSKPWTNL